MSNLQKTMMRSHLPPMVPTAVRYSSIECIVTSKWTIFYLRQNSIHRDVGNRKGRQKDYMPTMWDEHFNEKEDVVLENDQKFRVYFTQRDRENKKPLLVLLHGGGYSALTWAHFTVIVGCIYYLEWNALYNTVYIFIAQTEITAIIDCQCLAIDLRGHGDTHVSNESDLSANTLAK